MTGYCTPSCRVRRVSIAMEHLVYRPGPGLSTVFRRRMSADAGRCPSSLVLTGLII